MAFDNDDDLFDYEPESNDSSNISIDYETDSLKLTQEEQEFVNSIKSSQNYFGNLNEAEVKLAVGYLESSYNFIEKESSPNGHLFALRYTMDELTEGRFSLLELFKTTEMKILRLLSFINLSESIFGDDGQSFKEILKDIFDIDVGDLHVRLIYNTHLAISRHSLVINRNIYTQLSEKLNIPIEPKLLENNIDVDEIKISYSNLAENVHTNIIKQLAEEGLTSKVSEAFTTHVNYNQG